MFRFHRTRIGILASRIVATIVPLALMWFYRGIAEDVIFMASLPFVLLYSLYSCHCMDKCRDRRLRARIEAETLISFAAQADRLQRNVGE